jgi:tRNA(Ile)-lysidine synthetase-like protein
MGTLRRPRQRIRRLAQGSGGAAKRREYDSLRFVTPSAVPGAVADVAVEDGTPPDGPYVVRGWQPGDRMRPSALHGHSRKLSDLFVDRKIPASLRRQARVVVRARDGAIVWAEHVGPSVDARLQVALTRRDPPAI